jgi:hypothetical protein
VAELEREEKAGRARKEEKEGRGRQYAHLGMEVRWREKGADRRKGRGPDEVVSGREWETKREAG